MLVRALNVAAFDHIQKSICLDRYRVPMQPNVPAFWCVSIALYLPIMHTANHEYVSGSYL